MQGLAERIHDVGQHIDRAFLSAFPPRMPQYHVYDSGVSGIPFEYYLGDLPYPDMEIPYNHRMNIRSAERVGAQALSLNDIFAVSDLARKDPGNFILFDTDPGDAGAFMGGNHWIIDAIDRTRGGAELRFCDQNGIPFKRFLLLEVPLDTRFFTGVIVYDVVEIATEKPITHQEYMDRLLRYHHELRGDQKDEGERPLAARSHVAVYWTQGAEKVVNPEYFKFITPLHPSAESAVSGREAIDRED